VGGGAGISFFCFDWGRRAFGVGSRGLRKLHQRMPRLTMVSGAQGMVVELYGALNILKRLDVYAR